MSSPPAPPAAPPSPHCLCANCAPPSGFCRGPCVLDLGSAIAAEKTAGECLLAADRCGLAKLLQFKFRAVAVRRQNAPSLSRRPRGQTFLPVWNYIESAVFACRDQLELRFTPSRSLSNTQHAKVLSHFQVFTCVCGRKRNKVRLKKVSKWDQWLLVQSQ